MWRSNPSSPDAMVSGSRAFEQIKAGKGAIVPRSLVKQVGPRPDLEVLDFGCGATAPHVYALRKCGFDVVGYDLRPDEDQRLVAYLASVESGLIDKRALGRRYDVVLLSNVLNVQSSRSKVVATLKAASAALRAKGNLLCNMPTEPNLAGVSHGELGEILSRMFQHLGEDRLPGKVWWAAGKR